MFRRLRALYTRYLYSHFRLGPWALPLRVERHDRVGHLDRITFELGQLQIAGWSQAERLIFHADGFTREVAPHLLREDVANALDCAADCGFQVSLPWREGPIAVDVIIAGRAHRVELSLPKTRRHRLAKAALRLRFLRDLLRSAPALLRLLWADNPASRAVVKYRMGLIDQTTHSNALEHRLFDQTGLPPTRKDVPITIVLPVFNAFEILQDCLDRVARHTDLPWHLVLVEDASTDPRVLPWLRSWSDWYGDNVTLLENSENLGFIGSVNRGFEAALARKNHVVLLNSDALVPQNWASRLLRPIARHDKIASVTPMSNDATILNILGAEHACTLSPGEGDALDAMAGQFNPEAQLSVIPTGVGFCMAINRDFLTKLPSLDTAFGKGYGEEVDWCQRARALGGRHLALPGLFVEHQGGESFGSEQKRELVRRNGALISHRYPLFDAEVAQVISADPLLTPRLALALGRLAHRASGPVPLYIAHSMGGGAEKYLSDRIADDIREGEGAVVLRVGGAKRWTLEAHLPSGCISGATDDLEFIKRLVSQLPHLKIVYSDAVGDPDPVALPSVILALKEAAETASLDVLFHDFFPLSPSYTLLDGDGVFRGLVEAERGDAAHVSRRPDGTLVTLSGWRAAWSPLLHSAERVVVFSQDSRSHVLRVYPELAKKLRVEPHRMTQMPRLVRSTPHAPERIGVLGNIGRQKGARVVQDLAALLAAEPEFDLIVIGNVDPAFPLPGHVPVTGNYHVEDISTLAEKHQITRWLIPSVWPETFSFTTHEALATGLPVHAFYIGAQGQAVASAENGIAVHFDSEGDLAANVLNSLPQLVHQAAA